MYLETKKLNPWVVLLTHGRQYFRMEQNGVNRKGFYKNVKEKTVFEILYSVDYFTEHTSEKVEEV